MTTPFSPPLYMQRYQFVIDYVQTYRPRKVNECQTWILKLICDGLWRIVWASLLIVVFFTCSYLDFISSFVTPSAGHRFRMRWMSLTEKTEVSSQRYTVTSGSWYQQCRPPEKNVSLATCFQTTHFCVLLDGIKMPEQSHKANVLYYKIVIKAFSCTLGLLKNANLASCVRPSCVMFFFSCQAYIGSTCEWLSSAKWGAFDHWVVPGVCHRAGAVH